MTDGQVANLLRAEIVTNEHRGAAAERLHDVQHVVHHEVRVVQRGIDGAIAASVATLVDRDRAIAGCRQRG